MFSPALLSFGSRVIVTAAALVAVMGSAHPISRAATECQATHIVQRGETLYRIGLKYSLSWDKIAAANGITDANRIRTGQALCIPVSTSAQPTPEAMPVKATDITAVMAETNVNIRVGPGVQYRVIGTLFTGRTARVTGVTTDNLWWRVPCPSGGDCFITARPEYTTGAVAAGGPVVNPTPTPSPTQPAAIPSIDVTTVVRDQTVTFTASNLPADKAFDIRIGAAGSEGIGGLVVGSATSGADGTFTTTVTIPADFRGSSQLVLRIDAKGGWYSYSTFSNR